MSKSIIIYDPPMCCSTGVCGPNPDSKLIELQDTIDAIKKQGHTVERYLITQSPQKFKDNPEVIKLIQEQQLKVLPITCVDNRIIKTGDYPTLEELQNHIQE